MHSLFREAATHAALARTLQHIGSGPFWRQVILLLRHWVEFDNALAIHIPRAGAPVALEEYDAEPLPRPAASPLYLDGLYLLDPFYVAAQDGIASGFYRLEELAPDHFRQTEYYLNYFHDNVLEDEVQFIVQLPEAGALSLSLGMRRAYSVEEVGLLTLVAPWVIALIEQHWGRGEQRPVVNRPVGDALAGFGEGVLSERELEIAQLILRGYSSKAMAKKLGISPETVKVHRRHLYSKLNIASQPELFSLFISRLELSESL